MADTIINTPGSTRTSDDASAAGWVVAIIVILAILFGGFFLLRRGVAPAGVPNTGAGANINVTLPTGGGSTGGTTGGGTGGGTTQ